jgi:hypothetical protein
MSERAEQLHTTADIQIAELIDLISAADGATLRRPCPGREKLGDGTIGAMAAHTAENYQRIGTFVTTSERMADRHNSPRRGRHRLFGLRASGHTARDHGQHGPGGRDHGDGYSAETAQPGELMERLEAARKALARTVQLTDAQLDEIPPKDSFRFCDGQRTLEQVLAGLLTHQEHQVRTLRAALAGTP